MLFACLVAVIAFVGLAGSIAGSQAGFKDWGFHSCFARSLDAAGCSNGAYEGYALLIHAPAFALNWLGFAPEWFFALLVAGCLVFVACVLFDYAGFAGFAGFFFVAPVISVYALRNGAFLWFNWGLCGNLAWVAAFAVFAWLVLAWRDLSAFERLEGFIALMLVHNYGWGLVALLSLASLTLVFGRSRFPSWLNYRILVLAGLLAAVFLSGSPAVAARLWSPVLLVASVEVGVWWNGRGTGE
jgi:hypothetical protein